MSRDPGRLQAFVMADDLVVDAYRATASFPAAERFGLQSQIRRVLSRCRRISSRAVPGDRERDYLHFVGIAIGSASEVRYLVGLAVRLGFANEPDGQRLKVGYSRVIRALQALVTSLSSPEARSPRPEAP